MAPRFLGINLNKNTVKKDIIDSFFWKFRNKIPTVSKQKKWHKVFIHNRKRVNFENQV